MIMNIAIMILFIISVYEVLIGGDNTDSEHDGDYGNDCDYDMIRRSLQPAPILKNRFNLSELYLALC